MKVRNFKHAMALVEQFAEVALRKLESDVVVVFERDGGFPDSDDLERLLQEQRAALAVWLVTARAELEAHYERVI
jgi:phage terminase large subunit-like protein